jgi:hypothetical protein
MQSKEVCIWIERLVLKSSKPTTEVYYPITREDKSLKRRKVSKNGVKFYGAPKSKFVLSGYLLN